MRVWRDDMSFEIDLLNTYHVCGQEPMQRLYHVETVKDWQGSDVEVPVYDVPDDIRMAMAVARLMKERQLSLVSEAELMQAA